LREKFTNLLPWTICLLIIFFLFEGTALSAKSKGKTKVEYIDEKGRVVDEYGNVVSKGGSKKPKSKGRITNFKGKVLRVINGDIIDVIRDGKQVRIRLAGIDCPEVGMPFGDKAKKYVTRQLLPRKGKTTIVTVNIFEKTPMWLIGEIILADGRSLNRELLKEGLAWWVPKHSNDESLGLLEIDASWEQKGLWGDPEGKKLPLKQRKK
jgi:endonuclease YncB( thermonuclease family)